MIPVNASNPGLSIRERYGFRGRAAAKTWIPAKTRVPDQKPLACSAFFPSRGCRVGALWTNARHPLVSGVKQKCQRNCERLVEAGQRLIPNRIIRDPPAALRCDGDGRPDV
jgi:hypothetical protein